MSHRSRAQSPHGTYGLLHECSSQACFSMPEMGGPGIAEWALPLRHDKKEHGLWWKYTVCHRRQGSSATVTIAEVGGMARKISIRNADTKPSGFRSTLTSLGTCPTEGKIETAADNMQCCGRKQFSHGFPLKNTKDAIDFVDFLDFQNLRGAWIYGTTKQWMLRHPPPRDTKGTEIDRTWSEIMVLTSQFGTPSWTHIVALETSNHSCYIWLLWCFLPFNGVY